MLVLPVHSSLASPVFITLLAESVCTWGFMCSDKLQVTLDLFISIIIVDQC